MIGKIMSSKNYGKFQIIELGKKYNYYKIKFLNTDFEYEFRKDAIEKGEVRDKYAITLCGFGIIGNIKTRGKNKQLYNVWHNMIERCYSGHNTSYYNKVFVCSEWQTFEYFYNSVKTICGWNEEKFINSMIVLDKDKTQRFQDFKLYSPQTCCWIQQKENNDMQDSQQKIFRATSPNGEIYEDHNISRFGREHGLERKQISAVLHKRFNTTLGWKFQYIDKEMV